MTNITMRLEFGSPNLILELETEGRFTKIKKIEENMVKYN